MIGRFLLTLTTEQEDAVLTERLARAPRHVNPDGCRCLVGVVHGWTWDATDERPGPRSGPTSPGLWDDCFDDTLAVGILFDELCLRFGETRVNAAIRNRILSNRARRELRQPEVAAVA